MSTAQHAPGGWSVVPPLESESTYRVKHPVLGWLLNASGWNVRFRSKEAAVCAAEKLNGAPTHWMDDRELIVTDAFLKSDKATFDYRAVYNIPCVMLNGRPVAIAKADGDAVGGKSGGAK